MHGFTNITKRDLSSDPFLVLAIYKGTGVLPVLLPVGLFIKAPATDIS